MHANVQRVVDAAAALGLEVSPRRSQTARGRLRRPRMQSGRAGSDCEEPYFRG